MITNLLKKTAFPVLSRGLDNNSLNRKVISHNIANINTPGYQKKEVAFNDTLRDSMKQLDVQTTQSNHLPSGSHASAQVVNSADQAIKNGVNNVDIDQEMVELAKNQMEFNVSATILSRIFKSIKGAITEKPGF